MDEDRDDEGDAYYPPSASSSSSGHHDGSSGSSSSHRWLTCFCLGHCPDDHNNNNGLHHEMRNGTCLSRPGAGCFAAVEEVLDPETGNLVPERTYGCLPPEDGALLQCKGHLVPHLNPTSIACCSDADLCNKHLSPMYEHRLDDDEGLSGVDNSSSNRFASMDHTTSLALLVSLTVCFIIFVLLIAYAYLRYKKREDHRQKYVLAARTDPDSFLRGHPGTLHDLIEQSSGSGSGLPLLVQRTIAKQITMERAIGKGRYGEVWLAKWRGESVAVKVFCTSDEASWFRETEIYQTVLMRHDNILGFIAADIRGSGGWTQMLLLTDHHENGSLYDYLNHHALSTEEMLRLCYTFICGLSHLHTEIHGTRGKPAIAHRDIKSRNVLVKKDGLSCAIADFGLAVRFDSEKDEVDMGAHNSRVGTIRYMSSENLDQSLNATSFAAFLQADMYSVGLVMWEIARKTTTGEKLMSCDEYQLPFFEFVNPDPSFEEMHTVVCMKEARPNPSPRWKSCRSLSKVSKLMAECWAQNPSARLTALRVKKDLSLLLFNEVSADDIGKVV